MEIISNIHNLRYKILCKIVTSHISSAWTLSPISVFAGLSQEVVDKILDYTERYILTRLYRGLFCPATTAEEEKDLAIQTKIRSLHWVTAQQLDLIINDHDPAIRMELDQAITGYKCV